MTYQPSAYPAAAGGHWPAPADAYHQYYAAYGYGAGYDMSSYYQQHVPQYPAAVPGSSAQPDSKAPEQSEAAQPSSKQASETPSVPVSSNGAACEQVKGDTPPPPPPPPPPGAPETEKSKGEASTVPAGTADATASAPVNYDSAAYAQWYAQTYGAYYSYPGYDQHAYAYWHQQQMQQQQQYPEAYAYASHANAHQPSAPSAPPQAPQGSFAPVKQPQHSASAPPAQMANGYHAQPPPSGLYSQHPANKGSQDRHRTGMTGANTVPLGPRAPSSVQGASTQQQPALVIRPQLPAMKRPNASAAPAYIAVGSAPSGPSNSGNDPAVAAAVAAGAASAAAAAAAAKAAAPPTAAKGAGSNASQWPPSFTAWVTRCFNAARLRNIPDGRLSEKLMAYLDHVKAEGKLWTTDWDTQPVMLPDGSSEPHGASGASGADTVLSVGEPHSLRRSRWGAVPEAHHAASAAEAAGPGQYPHPSSARQLKQFRKRASHMFDSDDGEDQYGGKGGPSPHHQKVLGGRKRKKALQLEHDHMQGRRAGRGAGAFGVGGLSQEEQRRRARAGRFGDGRAAGAAPGSPQEDSSSEMDMSDEEDLAVGRFGGIVVGTCQALEKSYFRLTSQPDPSTVRPEPVLERALERLVSLIARGEATYFYSLDQFKGMRQDCTVQHLRNSLAVRVYEAHARSSLEYGDISEFNQCQARLGHLYSEGQPGCMTEFTAYRLLYETVHCATAGGRGGGMAKALLHTMRNVPKELMDSPEIRHALQVREAVMTYNYAAFFRLYATAPHLGRALMDVVAESMRWAGLNAFVKACDLPIPVPDVALLLGFVPRSELQQQQGQEGGQASRLLPGCMRTRLEGDAAAAADAEQGAVECAAWLRDHGAIALEKGAELLLDCKASRGKLFVPEVTAKVAHGDENLSVNDFLSAAQRNLAE